MSDVKRKTVDEVTSRVVEEQKKRGNAPNVEKAREAVAREAEKLNRQRRGEK